MRGESKMLPIAIDEIISLLTPVVLAWAKYIAGSGKDPATELKILLDTADATVDAAELAKFGNIPATKPSGSL